MAKKLRENIVGLSNLSYTNMKLHLYAKGVITTTEKLEIDRMIVSSDQMERVIEIVRTSLLNKHTKKFKGLLESMEESEDDLLKETAIQYGECISIRHLPNRGRIVEAHVQEHSTALSYIILNMHKTLAHESKYVRSYTYVAT